MIKDDQVIASVQEDCWKKQSEYIFPVITKMTEDNNIRPEDIDNVVITKGPGSFTGVRIAMTIAKVFCAMAGKQLYTLETLQLYAGKKDCTVLLDARGKRAYTARFHDGKPLTETAAVPLNEIELSDEDIVIGDGHLAGLPDNYPDLAENFLALKNEWKAVENVHLLTPEYLKSTSDYMVKK